MKFICKIVLILLLNTQSFSQQKDTASIVVDLSINNGSMKPIWAWFGYDEPNYTYMKDGKKLLGEIAALSYVPVYVRAHSLLVTGDGKPALKWGSTNAYTEDADGNPVYDWRITDSIFDTYIQLGMKPLAQIGFMPEALSTNPQPYKHNWEPGNKYSNIFTGWAYPPKDHKKWAALVYAWVDHCINRYGKKEVESWYWELWNEPDIPYWKGTLQEYCKLYDYTTDAVKRALPTAKIGGADVTGGGNKFLDTFLHHCLYDTNYVTGKIGSPLDLISFHAKGSPKLVNGVVVMSLKNQMNDIARNFKVIQSYPQLKNIPVIIGESDPEGCAACGMATNPENAYRNGTMYSSYEAASFARHYELMKQYDINLTGAVTWAFEFENQPWFYGFRDLATNGVDKPVLNVFRMLGMMKGEWVKAESDRQYSLQQVLDSSIRGKQTDIGVMATKENNTAAIMLWNYHDADIKGDTSKVSISINNIPAKKIKFTQYRIDDAHSNSYEIWKKMGSPQNPTTEQIATLEKAGQLQQINTTEMLDVIDHSVQIRIVLPRQAVTLLKINW
ncbi:MAG TPA: beta-xylosidase [Parafilimonas sp.]|nr:beta-xylosidase [Parafilimonas sp.]